MPPFRAWVARIAPDATMHEIEGALRERWRSLVEEIAAWMPKPWPHAIRWYGVLADLPVVQYLARRERSLPWMSNDPVYRTLMSAASDAPTTESRAAVLAPLDGGWRRPDDLRALWRTEWLRRLPRDPTPGHARSRVLQRALEVFQPRVVASETHVAAAQRRQLAASLVTLFHQSLLDPAAAFAFLALSALDRGRLRGELARRAALPRMALAG